MAETHEDACLEAMALIKAADALLIGAGAGIGVDSGLPDFRGNEGFWNAYPPFRKLNLSFVDLANPIWFSADPEQAWGFYGHRLNLYRATTPHAGFEILRRWGEGMSSGYFVFTSNVDGQFQRAGFSEDRILECHGSIHHFQCAQRCCREIWPADDIPVDVVEETIRARPPLPECPKCGDVARPNILMFGDFGWIPDREDAQRRRYDEWLYSLRGKKLAIVECGAGTAVPTVRYECERQPGTLIRVNTREPEVSGDNIGLPLGCLEAVTKMDGAV